MRAFRIIETEDDLAEGSAWLARAEPRFADALAEAGPLPLRRRRAGFGPLLETIMAQQLSVASADAIWARLVALGADRPEVIRTLDDDTLRAAGLSRQKLRYARALADAGIDFDALEHLPDEEVVRQLTAVTGIGVWTAEIYLMFSLGRADVFAAGDLALQEAVRALFALETRPGPKHLAARAAEWSPWRGVAARLLWSYYGVLKGRQGVIGAEA